MISNGYNNFLFFLRCLSSKLLTVFIVTKLDYQTLKQSRVNTVHFKINGLTRAIHKMASLQYYSALLWTGCMTCCTSGQDAAKYLVPNSLNLKFLNINKNEQ